MGFLYALPYTPANSAWRSRLVRDQDRQSVTFCDLCQQESTQYPSWPRLRAFPGAEVFLPYSSFYKNFEEEGEIALYGAMALESPDLRKISDFFDTGNGIYVIY
ncbi:uncharacterized protein N7484_007030 [Penicillium longicatenatum]|uniref:uncharacterized protein n=1 Tax=Penicillium longicatenatum TaxID=1561947 RepID=UPI0025473C5A|nr:uncharacterized protein N7484_007030 [Penicillium longicatenatum]KAJ5639168.1 hypothetical protein N7484_007030 [Penicillium longicatenatum]